MNKQTESMRIEELGLDDSINKKLKDAFIYTVADLQVKTNEDLATIRCFEYKTLEQIKSYLMRLVKFELKDSIEPSDRLENLGLGQYTYLPLKRAGISRISDLARLSGLELFTITRVGETALKEIKDKLSQYYGKDFGELQEGVKQRNTNAVSIGHLNGIADFFQDLRDANIYTIGDVQRTIDEDLVKLKGVGKSGLKVIKKQLEQYGVERYGELIKKSSIIEKLGLNTRAYRALKDAQINMIDELAEFTISDLMTINRIGQGSAMEIAEAYVNYYERCNTDSSQENSEKTELERLAKLKRKMQRINAEMMSRKKKLSEILEELRDENRNSKYVKII